MKLIESLAKSWNCGCRHL